jgi:hypothetical protein
VSRERNGTGVGATSGEEKPLSSDANRVHQAVDPARLISDLCSVWSGHRMRCEGGLPMTMRLSDESGSPARAELGRCRVPDGSVYPRVRR